MTDPIPALIERACPGSEIAGVVPRSGGALSTVFEVLLLDQEPVIVKIYAAEWAWKQSKELFVYQLLTSELGDLIPSVLHAEAAVESGGSGFTVLTKVPGVPLSAAAPTDWRATYVQIGKILHRIHQLHQPAFGYLTDHQIEPSTSNVEYMSRQFARKLREFKELGGDGGIHAALTQRVGTAGRVFDGCTTPRLCHNDFHEGNVLIEDGAGRVTGFVDVENAIAADPLMDLAKTDCYSIRGNAEKMAGLLQGYGAKPPDFTARMDIYRIYHLLELWDWFASIGTTDPLDGIARDLDAALSRSHSVGTA